MLPPEFKYAVSPTTATTTSKEATSLAMVLEALKAVTTAGELRAASSATMVDPLLLLR
jgi:hypothetical protein